MVGVIWGTGQGGMETFEQQVTEYALGDGHPRFSPFFVPKFLTNMASAHDLYPPTDLWGLTIRRYLRVLHLILPLWRLSTLIRLGKAKNHSNRWF